MKKVVSAAIAAVGATLLTGGVISFINEMKADKDDNVIDVLPHTDFKEIECDNMEEEE